MAPAESVHVNERFVLAYAGSIDGKIHIVAAADAQPIPIAGLALQAEYALATDVVRIRRAHVARAVLQLGYLQTRAVIVVS